MPKSVWILILVIVLAGVLGLMGRHSISAIDANSLRYINRTTIGPFTVSQQVQPTPLSTALGETWGPPEPIVHTARGLSLRGETRGIGPGRHLLDIANWYRHAGAGGNESLPVIAGALRDWLSREEPDRIDVTLDRAFVLGEALTDYHPPERLTASEARWLVGVAESGIRDHASLHDVMDARFAAPD